MPEEPVVAIILFLVGLLVGLRTLAAGRYSEKNLPAGEGYPVVKGSAFRMRIAGYAIAGFCFIGLVRTLILLLF